MPMRTIGASISLLAKSSSDMDERQRELFRAGTLAVQLRVCVERERESVCLCMPVCG